MPALFLLAKVQTFLRAAGILPPITERNERIERILDLLEDFSEEELDRIEVLFAALTTR